MVALLVIEQSRLAPFGVGVYTPRSIDLDPPYAPEYPRRMASIFDVVSGGEYLMASDEETGALTSWNGSSLFTLYLMREDGGLEPIESFTKVVRSHVEAHRYCDELLKMWRES